MPTRPCPRHVRPWKRAKISCAFSFPAIICLDERGVTRTSRDFARWLDELSADATRRPCFVVGGPFGLDDAVRARARHMVAFGAQTLPHELARVLLLEQLYRAESLLRNTPYHHE